MISTELRAQLGPLAPLAGIWEGDKGFDLSPSPNRGPGEHRYRERITLEQIGPVQNHEQNLHVLRYSTRAWRLGDENSFHEEVGYWSWEPANSQVMRSFLIPRGISVLALGTAERDAREFTCTATNGSCTDGVCTNPFLDREFKIVSYTFKVTIHDENSFHYWSDTILKLPNRAELFHHVDENTLTRVPK